MQPGDRERPVLSTVDKVEHLMNINMLGAGVRGFLTV